MDDYNLDDKKISLFEEYAKDTKDLKEKDEIDNDLNIEEMLKEEEDILKNIAESTGI